jgi:hypothetical protein
MTELARLTRTVPPVHHDGHGLNDLITITSDERDPDGGGASHRYRAVIDVSGTRRALEAGCTGQACEEVLTVQFQHGPRHLDSSTPGATDQVLLAILIDRYRGFQAGPFACRENALALTKMEEALHWMEHRANDRARRGVLGRNEK